MTKIRGRVKELWLDFLYDIAGGFLQAVALHCFIDSIDIAPGGATGLAILLNRFTSLPIGILTFAVNVPLLIAAWIYLGKGRTIKTLKTVAVLTVILGLHHHALCAGLYGRQDGVLYFWRRAYGGQSGHGVHARLHHRRR